MINTFAYATVDTIQACKKQFVKTFISNKEISDILYSFIDNQTTYTKSAINSGVDTLAQLSNVIASKSFRDEVSDMLFLKRAK